MFLKRLPWLALCLALGCGEKKSVPSSIDAGIQVAKVEEGLSATESCQTIAAAATFTGVPYAYSPTTYDPAGCNKGYVVDLNARASSQYFTGTYVSWADHQIPTTQSTCEDIRLAAYVWERPTSGSPIFLRSRSKAGVWVSGTCEVPVLRVEDFVNLEDGKRYRFAVQARDHANSPYSTREVAVTNAPVWSNGAKTSFTTTNAGQNVAVDGSVAVVTSATKVYILQKIGNAWSTQATFSIPPEFGGASAVDVKNTTVVVGLADRVLVYTNLNGLGWIERPNVRPWVNSDFGQTLALDVGAGGVLGLVVGNVEPQDGQSETSYFVQLANGEFSSTPNKQWDEGGQHVAFRYPYVFSFGDRNPLDVNTVFVRSVTDPTYSATLTTSDIEALPAPNATRKYSEGFGGLIVPTASGVYISSSFAVYQFTQGAGTTWTSNGRILSIGWPGVYALGVNSTHLFVGDASSSSGTATGGAVTQYFKASDSSWYPERRLVAKALPAAAFGSALDVTDTELFVGAPTEKASHVYALPLPCENGAQCDRPLECDGNGDCGFPLFCSAGTQGQVTGLPGVEACIPDACGTSRQCSATCICAEGGFDCDSDTECEGQLDCIENVGDRVGVQKFISVCLDPNCDSMVDKVPGASDYCTAECPCGVGLGHCDGTSECMTGLSCSGNGPNFGFASGVNVCIPDHCKNALQDEDETGVDCGGFGCGRCTTCPTFSQLGASGFCTTQCPCDQGQGSCTANSGCRPHTTDWSTSVTLQCKSNVGANYGWASSVDVCERSDCTRSGPTNTPGDSGFCTTACPCASGFGDCDSDDGSSSDCLRGLKCVSDNGPKFGLGSTYDVCVPPHCANDTKDGDETDVDCGGSCGGCTNSMDCNYNSDCRQDLDGNGTNDLLCDEEGFCYSDLCLNNIQNSFESDIDCGGFCPCCSQGKSCDQEDDCCSGSDCIAGACVPDTCNNAQKDGNETGIDCGGSCRGCGQWQGGGCDTDADCLPGTHCVDGLCILTPDCGAATCGNSNDGIGGECPGVCSDGQTGCHSDVNCDDDLICVPTGQGVGICKPKECARTSVAQDNCGFPGAPCGDCPGTFPVCLNRNCGIDPNTGVDCGTCGTGTTCNGSGQCANFASDPPLVVPDGQGSGGNRTITDLEVPPTATEVGVLNGAFSVTDSGAASYTIPIDVPPGRAGIEPELSLQYTGTRVNSTVGSGWIINGLSAITRCPRTIALDGYKSPITNTAQDRFCLDGKPLDVVTSTSAKTEYATHIDTFAKIEGYHTSAQEFLLPDLPGIPSVIAVDRGPHYFKVWTKEGKILTFGNTQDSTLLSRTDVRVAWMVSRVEDHAGNSMVVSYLNTLENASAWFWDNVPGVMQPLSIKYTGTSAATGDREVRFIYEERPDPVVTFRHGGVPAPAMQRLARIATYAKKQPVQSYKIQYFEPVLGELAASQVEKVTKCIGVSDNCVSPTTFTYDQDVGFERSDWQDANHDLGAFQAYQFDADSNGIADLLQLQLVGWTSPNNSTVSAVSKASDIANDVASSYIPFPYGYIVSFAYGFISPSIFGQFTDRPKPVYGELIARSTGDRENPYTVTMNPPGLQGTCFNGTGDSTFAYPNTFFADYNFDGHDDLLATCLNTYPGDPNKVWRMERVLSTSNGFSAPQILKDSYGNPLYFNVPAVPAQYSTKEECNVFGCHTVQTPGPLPLVYDVDGDTLEDVLVCSSYNRMRFYRRLPVASGGPEFADPVEFDTDEISGDYFCHETEPVHVLMDADGDGVSNLLVRGSDGWGMLRYVNGSFTWVGDVLQDVGLSTYGKGLKTGDFNGDGLLDIYGADGLVAYIWLNTGTGRFLLRVLVKDDTPLTQGGFAAGDYQRTMILDYDGDGRSDILELWDHNGIGQGGGTKTYVYRTNAAVSAFVESFEDLTIRAVDELGVGGQESAYWTQAIDLDGDGALDLLSTADPLADNAQINYGKVASTKLLTSVVDGYGKFVTVEYDKDAYTKNSSCFQAQIPTRCVPKVSTLVSAHTEGLEDDSGTQEERRFIYRYFDAVADPTGEGFLGFKRREVEEFKSPATNTWEFRQKTTIEYQPFTPFNAQGEEMPGSLVDDSHTFVLAGLPSVITVESAPFTNPLMKGSYVRQTITSNVWKHGISARQKLFPRLDERDVQIVDKLVSSGAPSIVSQTHETFITNGYGSIVYQDVTTSADGACSSKETYTDYQIVSSNWLISNPVSIRVDSHRDGDTKIEINEQVYDSDTGLLLQTTRSSLITAGERTVTFERDDTYGNVELVTEVSNTSGVPSRVTSIQYDADGIFPLKVEQAVAGVSNFAYQIRTDARWGLPKSVADPNGIVSQFGYDELGNLVETQDENGTTHTTFERISNPDSTVAGTAYHIRPMVSVTTTREGLGGTPDGMTIQELDPYERVVRTHQFGFQGVELIQEQVYDNLGRPIVIFEPRETGVSPAPYTALSYDVLDRLTAESSLLTGQASGPTKTYQYASRESLVGGYGSWIDGAACGAEIKFSTDESNQRTAILTDPTGLVVRSIDDEHLDATVISNNYQYDALGNLTDAWDNAGNLVTQFTYDSYGRRLTHVDIDSGPTTYEYNDFDEVKKSTHASQVRQYSYDELGRLRTLIDPAGTTTWTYDVSTNGANAKGRLTETLAPGANGARVAYVYELGTPTNNRGALKQVTTTLDGVPYVTSLEYDDLGRTKRVTYPSRTSGAPIIAEYDYDSTGILSSLKEVGTSTPRSLWQLNSAFQGLRPQQETFGNGVVTNYSYNSDQKRLWVGMIKTSLGATTLQRQDYAYYPNGQLLTKVDAQPSRGTHTYYYDGLGRLKQDYHSSGSGAFYRYDALGNLTKNRGADDQTSKIISYSGGTAKHQVVTAYGNAYSYGARGNVASRQGPDVPGTRQEFDYTPFDLPAVVRTGLAPNPIVTTQFEYTADEARVIERIGNGNVRHSIEGLYEVLENSTHVVIEEQFKLFAGDRQIGEIKRSGGTDETFYFHQDYLGSVDTITNGSGQAQRQEFYPYGGTVSSLGTPFREGFTGHEHDLDLGLVDMKGRSYDPIAGRFMSQDPIIQAPYWSQGLNRYSYVFNDPINLTDPSGFTADVGPFGFCPYGLGYSCGSGSSSSMGSPGTGPAADGGRWVSKQFYGKRPSAPRTPHVKPQSNGTPAPGNLSESPAAGCNQGGGPWPCKESPPTTEVERTIIQVTLTAVAWEYTGARVLRWAALQGGTFTIPIGMRWALSRLATRSYNQFLTQAGRALTKHPEVAGLTKETIKQVLKTDAALNATAKQVLDGVLRNGTASIRALSRYGLTLEVKAAEAGVRFSLETGEFIGFILP